MTMSINTSVVAAPTSNAKVVISEEKYNRYAELLSQLAAIATPSDIFDVSKKVDVENVLVKVAKQCDGFVAHRREEAVCGIRVKCEAIIDAARQTRVRAVAAWKASEDMQAAMPGFDEQTHIRLLAKQFVTCMSETLTFQQVCNNLTNMGYNVSVPDGRKKGPQDHYIIVPIAKAV